MDWKGVKLASSIVILGALPSGTILLVDTFFSPKYVVIALVFLAMATAIAHRSMSNTNN